MKYIGDDTRKRQLYEFKDITGAGGVMTRYQSYYFTRLRFQINGTVSRIEAEHIRGLMLKLKPEANNNV
jgi:hypothetical protein